VGIAMGSYWAYYELGWGGFWFWDPVENASLMPWLVATALLHSAVVMEKRDALKIWTVLLAILAFSLSLIGTFLVRSGVLTSVHAFASDPTRGVFILLILVIFIGGALTLFAMRAGALAPGGVFAPISREGALIVNNVFLTAAAATVVVGTLYPLALEALTGMRISVGAPFFNLTFVPLVVPLLAIVPFGPLLAWKRGDLLAATQRLMLAFGIALAGAIVAGAFAGYHNMLALAGIWLGVWLIAGALSEVALRVKLGSLAPGDSLRRALGLPRSVYGTMFAHAGVGLTVLGLVAVTTWQGEIIRSMKPGDTATLAGYELTLDGFVKRDGSNYSETAVKFTVRQGGNTVAILEPAKRRFAASGTDTTESAIRTVWFSQLYLSIGDIAADGTVTARLYWKPLVTLIWLGALVMAFGGLLSLSDRRLRVGAPKPAKQRAQPAPAE
jgi:cytochrome c-type biogenesis protein CcmF